MISGRNLHEFSAFGKTYVFDAHRQQAFRLGPRALEIWEQHSDARNQTVPLAYSSDSDRRIWQLLADYHLVPPHLSPRPRGKPPRQDGHINFLMLHVAEGCNMRCRYCFSEGGLYGERRPRLMSERVGRAAVDFLLQHCATDVTPQIMFFGGEPLLNFRLIKSLIPYAESKAGECGHEISFSMTTNATLLNQRTRDTLLSHNVGLLISIDGVGRDNDVHRITSRGDGSFQYIAPRVRPLLSRRKTTARATLARENVSIEKIVLDLLRFGFQGVHVSVTGGEDPETLDETDWQTLLVSLERLAARYLKLATRGGLLPFLTFHEEVCALAERRITTKGCAAGRTYFNVLPDGTMNVCTRSVGGPAPYNSGNVLDGSFDRRVQEFFESRSVDTHPVCSRCWARYMCGGGCFARNMAKDGSDEGVDGEYCRFQKRLYELAVAVDFELTFCGIDPSSTVYDSAKLGDAVE